MWRIIDTMQEFIDRQTGVRSIMCEIAADTAADLPANSADRVFILGTFATAIDTGDIYKINSAGAWILQPSQNAFSNVYTKSEIDDIITSVYKCIMYYHSVLESNDGTITFYAFSGFVGHIDIYGNGQQTGTPTTSEPIIPEFCGYYDGVNWTIPITCAGQTVIVNLGDMQTVRKIRKFVLTGNEDWNDTYGVPMVNSLFNAAPFIPRIVAISDRYIYNPIQSGLAAGLSDGEFALQESRAASSVYYNIAIKDLRYQTAADFKSYLIAQNSAGTPVTIWYVLETSETGVVNEPLAKIGDYADELHITKTDISISTVSGENTLTIDTDLQPSKIVISGE